MTPVAELFARKHELTERIRCPVHGFIRYSRAEREIIDHWTFQRLRNVRQLALCYYVYPGAMHTRFEHSLGVMEMATRAFESLERKQGNLLTEELRQIPELKNDTLRRAKQVLRIYGLLHDTGHPPFSHVGEDSFPGGDHEAVSLHVVEKHLAEKIDSLFFAGAAGLLKSLMEKSQSVNFLRTLIAGEIDMDRTDYLRRDSLHCGVDYGRFDFLRLLETLTVARNKYDGRLQLAIERGGEHTFEALVLARYQMTTQVYFHRIRRIYDFYLKKYMESWAREHFLSLDDVLQYDDIELLAAISKDAKANNERTEIARRIIQRNHHKLVYETSDSAGVQELKETKLILAHFKEKFPEVDFILDEAKMTIHKQALPDQFDEEEKVDELYVVDRNGMNPKLITEQSAVLQKIDKKARCVRIYADAAPEIIEKIKAAALSKKREG